MAQETLGEILMAELNIQETKLNSLAQNPGEFDEVSLDDLNRARKCARIGDPDLTDFYLSEVIRSKRSTPDDDFVAVATGLRLLSLIENKQRFPEREVVVAVRIEAIVATYLRPSIVPAVLLSDP